MKVQMQMTIVGARFYDIANEKTGEIRRYTSIFTVEPMSEENDRAGMQPGKVRCNNSAVVAQLKGQKFPLEVNADCEMAVNAKGEAKIIVQSIKLPDIAPRKAA